jgi:hypothetical protein
MQPEISTGDKVPLAIASLRARRKLAVSWVENAFVEATLISGPACV